MYKRLWACLALYTYENIFFFIITRLTNLNMAATEGTYDGKELTQAAEVGDHERVASLLRAGANVNRSYQNEYNEVALWKASRNGHSKCIELLLDSGTNVNAMDANGYTCLMLSAQHGNHDCVQLFLEKGADVNFF